MSDDGWYRNRHAKRFDDQHEDATWLQDAVEFPDRTIDVSHVVHDEPTEDNIEARRQKRKLFGARASNLEVR